MKKLELTTDTAKAIYDSPCTSYWLKQAIDELTQRDPCDAARDAELLSAVMDLKLAQQIARTSPSRPDNLQMAQRQVRGGR